MKIICRKRAMVPWRRGTGVEDTTTAMPTMHGIYLRHRTPTWLVVVFHRLTWPRNIGWTLPTLVGSPASIDGVASISIDLCLVSQTRNRFNLVQLS